MFDLTWRWCAIASGILPSIFLPRYYEDKRCLGLFSYLLTSMAFKVDINLEQRVSRYWQASWDKEASLSVVVPWSVLTDDHMSAKIRDIACWVSWHVLTSQCEKCCLIISWCNVKTHWQAKLLVYLQFPNLLCTSARHTLSPFRQEKTPSESHMMQREKDNGIWKNNGNYKKNRKHKQAAMVKSVSGGTPLSRPPPILGPGKHRKYRTLGNDIRPPRHSLWPLPLFFHRIIRV